MSHHLAVTFRIQFHKSHDARQCDAVLALRNVEDSESIRLNGNCLMKHIEELDSSIHTTKSK